jgi:putative oxidoreductase
MQTSSAECLSATTHPAFSKGGDAATSNEWSFSSMVKKLLGISVSPISRDAALLALRVIGFVPLLLRHGLEKVFTFSTMAVHFPDPLHIGVVPSLIFAMVSDAICSTLIVLGIATRWAALIAFINIFVAWAFVHHFQFLDRSTEHGELILVYFAMLIALFLAGPGKYSIDQVLWEKFA